MKSDNKIVLLPKPQQIRYHAGEFVLQGSIAVTYQGDPVVLWPIARKLQQAVVSALNIPCDILTQNANATAPEGGVFIAIHKKKPAREQAYRLSVTPKGITILAQDAPGAFYGVATLSQILRQCKRSIPACEIDDYPDFSSRGIMLDISRDKVPTLDSLFALVDEFADLKLNHLQLYTEHTFAFRNHQEVWAQASPMTGQDILKLDAYCRERFVELAPNLNSFGHFHRWLEIPRYRDLAECPDGFDHPWGPGGRFNHPFSLNPIDPRSLTLLDELYSDMLPYFTSRNFNIGCDETIDLGLGKSKAICRKKGNGRVYLDFLLKLYKLVKRHGRIMNFWGDIIIQHPELVPELPKDIVVLEWGYEDTHPFEQHGEKFAQTGLPFDVCPGTSSWMSITGRTDNCLGNLRNAAANGAKYHARGFLITDWGDAGHPQYLPISYLGFAAGAALSWSYQAHRDDNFIHALDRLVFKDSANVMGKLAYDLGNAYRMVGNLEGNASTLAKIILAPAVAIPAGVTEKKLKATRQYIQDVMSPLAAARLDRPDGLLIKQEFANNARMLLHACDRGLAVRQGKLGDQAVRAALAKDMRIILGAHRELWMARNRVGGLQDSARRFEQLLDEYDGKKKPV